MTETVEQFLARGGQVKSLDMGYTAFPDGIIPMNPVRARESKETKAEKAKRIEEHNQKLREQKEEIKAQKLKKMQDSREQKKRLREAKKRQQIVVKKPKLVKPKIKPLKLVTFPEKSTAYWRALVNGLLRNTAEANGQVTFTGMCEHHGWSLRKIRKDRSTGCFECTNESARKNRKPVIKPISKERMRVESNKALMYEAIENGLSFFTANCLNCGDGANMQVYKKGNGFHYHCVVCKNKSAKKFQSRNAKPPAPLTLRREYIANVRKKMEAEGLKTIDMECLRHGVVEHRYERGRILCMTCKSNVQKKRVRKKPSTLRKESNNIKGRESAEKGIFRFTGECDKHGVTRYKVRQADYKKGRILVVCMACNQESSVASLKRQMVIRYDKPRNKEIREYVKNSGMSGRAFAEKMGITRAILVGMTCGKFEVSDERYELFKRVVSER